MLEIDIPIYVASKRSMEHIVQEICNKTFAHSYSGIQSIECTVLSPGMFGCCRINVLSVACGLEHTLALCRDGVRHFNLLLNLESFFII